MRPWRSGWTNLVVILAIFLIGPLWLSLLIAVVAVKLDKWYYYRRQMQVFGQPVDDPEVAAAGRAACERADLTGTEVVAVTGNGGPFLDLRDGRLLIARGALEILTEAELKAAILHRAVTPQGHAWRLEVEPHLPWGALTLVLSAVGFYGRFPAAQVAGIACLMAWAWSVGTRRAHCPWLTREHFQAFLDRGGDGRALAGALAKAAWYVAGDLPQGSIQDRAAARAWANLELLASMCGMKEAELVALADELGVADLYVSARTTTWHRMGFARTVFIYGGAAAAAVSFTWYVGHWISAQIGGW